MGKPLCAASLVIKPRIRSKEGADIVRRVKASHDGQDGHDIEAVQELEAQLTETPPESDDHPHW